MKVVFKLTPPLPKSNPPPPLPPRDYAADEICVAESLLMLSRSFDPTTKSITPAAEAPPPPAAVKKIKDWYSLPPLASNFPQRYTCDVCGKTCESYQALGGHKTCHRPKPPTAAAPTVSGGNFRVHECTTCRKQFSTGQALGGHKRKHFEGTIGADVNCKRSGGSPARDSSGVTVTEDDGCDRSHARTRNFDLNLPYTHDFFE